MNDKAKEILLKAKKEVFTGQIGDFLTSFKGDGLDFREIRDYNFDDNIKKINWKASNKGVGLKVNEFNEERELNIVILMLVSGSMHFGTTDFKKYIAAEVMSIIGLSGLKQNNRVQFIFYSNEEQKIFKPSKKDKSLFQALDYITEIDFKNKNIDNKLLVDFIKRQIKRKSLLFIIGDVLEKIDLKFLPYKHEIKNLIIRDHFEENPSLKGDFDLININNMKIFKHFLFSNNSINKYINKFKEIDDSNFEYFENNNIKYGKIYTNDNILLKLNNIFKRQK